MKRILGLCLTAAITLSSMTAFASTIPDHRGTSLENFEIGTAKLAKAVTQYSDIFKQAGDQYGVDPNLLAAICMQESSGVNWSYRDDGSEYPAWGIMQIEYTLEKPFAEFGLYTTGEEWTLQDRLDPEKSIPFAAHLISDSLIKYDCDYVKMIQSYNFGQTVLNRILAAAEENPELDWLEERKNAAQYATNWSYPTYGDAQYVEHVLRYYHNDIEYVGAKVRVDDKLINFEDQFPMIVDDGFTFIPVRAVAETLGADVEWDADNFQAIIEKDGSEIVIPIDSDYAFVDGDAELLDCPSQIINNRTMVPLRFVSESLGCTVDWDGETRTVLIYR